MDRESRPFVLALLAVVAVGVALLVVWPRVERGLAPQLVAAWVAVQPRGATAAQSGLVEIEAGTPFQLHAVLEARSPSGQPIYYTDATALVLDGRPIPSEAIRPWNRRRRAVLLWFTVEGFTAFFRVERPGQLSDFRLQEAFRPDWPRTWAIPGVLEPRMDDHLERQEAARDFGTQRYHVRIELYGSDEALVPEQRFRSPGAEALQSGLAAVTTVVASLPGNLATPSRAFGLTQVSLPDDSVSEVWSELGELWRRRLAFARILLLQEVVAQQVAEVEQLVWEAVDLSAGERRWGRDIRAGDLLRVGKRVVFLHSDSGDGVLDPSDRCLDFEEGAAFRRLDAVFSGGGVVQWASLGSGAV